MKHQIVSRYDASRVLFECDVPDNMASWLRTRHALEKAVADGAYLSGANLSDAKWRDGIKINRALLQLFGLHYTVHILDDHMQIGCELHALSEWRQFDDERIIKMDGKAALRFWLAHKAALLALAESDGRGVAQREAA